MARGETVSVPEDAEDVIYQDQWISWDMLSQLSRLSGNIPETKSVKSLEYKTDLAVDMTGHSKVI